MLVLDISVVLGLNCVYDVCVRLTNVVGKFEGLCNSVKYRVWLFLMTCTVLRMVSL